MSTTRRAAIAVAALLAAVCAAGVAPTGASGSSLVELWEREVDVPGRGILTGDAVDLDGDGADELLLHRGRGNEESFVIVLDGADGSEWWRGSFPARSCLLAADLDGNGRKEVVVACGGDLSVLDGTSGKRIGGRDLRGPVGDLAFGSAREGGFLICTSGTKRDDDLVVLSAVDLGERWHVEAEDASGPFASGFTYPTALDTDGDGHDEVVAVENGNRLVCLTSEGELRWDVGLGRRERLAPQGVVSARPVVADLLGDGVNEMAVGCFAGDVVVLDARTGEVLDRVNYGKESHDEHLDNPSIPSFIRAALGRTGEPVNCLTPVELDGGRGLELVLGCSDECVYAFDPGGGGTMWRVDTEEAVYDRCLLPDPGSLLLWDVTGAYLVDRGTGDALDMSAAPTGAPLEFGDTSTILAAELDGEDGLELVHVALERPRVTVWRMVAGKSR